jgi:hypothetical protein
MIHETLSERARTGKGQGRQSAISGAAWEVFAGSWHFAIMMPFLLQFGGHDAIQ